MLTKLGTSERLCGEFMEEFEKAKESKDNDERVDRLEQLIYRILASMRRALNDHILLTTCIWIMLNIMRASDRMKDIMLNAGVQGILCDILQNDVLIRGPIRQYANELCYKLW